MNLWGVACDDGGVGSVRGEAMLAFSLKRNSDLDILAEALLLDIEEEERVAVRRRIVRRRGE